MPATRSSTSARGDSSNGDQIVASTSHNVSAADPGLTVGPQLRATNSNSKNKNSARTEETKPPPLAKKGRALGWQKDNRPPRPSNAFISFKSSLKEGPLKREYSRRLAAGENIGVVAQQMWRNLTEPEREVWYAEARKAKEEHAKKYPGYKYRPRRRSSLSAKKGKKMNVAGGDDDDEEEEDELSEDTGPVLVEDNAPTAITPTSSRSDAAEAGVHGEPRTVEIYMGGSEDLDTLYKNGWKWALVRDWQPTALETPRDDSTNPVLHLSLDTVPSLEMISMASVMTHIDSNVSQTPFDLTTDSAQFVNSLNTWDSLPPQNAFYYDGPPNHDAPAFSESMLKVPGMGEASL